MNIEVFITSIKSAVKNIDCVYTFLWATPRLFSKWLFSKNHPFLENVLLCPSSCAAIPPPCFPTYLCIHIYTCLCRYININVWIIYISIEDCVWLKHSWSFLGRLNEGHSSPFLFYCVIFYFLLSLSLFSLAFCSGFLNRLFIALSVFSNSIWVCKFSFT